MTTLRWTTGAAVLLLISGLTGAALSAQELTTTQFERRASGESAVAVEVRYGAGEFDLAPAATGLLYRAVLHYDEEDFEPVHRFADGRLVVGVEGTSRSRPLRQSSSDARLQLRLSRTVPQDLRLELGAVRAQLDLGGIALSGLHLSTGASDTRISATEPNPAEMEELRFAVGAASLRADGLGYLGARRIQVEGGVGEVRLGLEGLERQETEVSASVGMGALEIRVPEGVGIRLTRSSFLSSLNAPFLERRGDAHYSDDWDTADRRVRISVDSALGSVRIARTDH
jgi:hypothetical protein